MEASHHTDLHVDPGKEEEMAHNYQQIFQPAIRRQPGFVAVQLLKRRSEPGGDKPAEDKYRFIISFEPEGLRLRWVSTDEHQCAWPTIDRTLTGSKYTLQHYGGDLKDCLQRVRRRFGAAGGPIAPQARPTLQLEATGPDRRKNALL